MIEFRILGPIEALRDGAPAQLGGRRQRVLLALLIVNRGRVVDSERLIEELWSGAPPAGAATTLRSYVSRLRHALGEAAPIVGSSSGYQLDADADAIDSVRFEAMVRDGEDALRRDAPADAAATLARALSLWRGRTFGDLADEGLLHAEAERLEELREHALEERIEADLELGRAAELVDELTGLVREHPYRERLWRQLMLALYRSERQADALATYQKARTMLDEEMGLEPSEELQALERAILRHEVPPPASFEARHNLPAPLTTFVGRGAELEELGAMVRNERLVTLTGVGGVGKTRLAIEVGRRAVHEFEDGVFLVDLSTVVEASLVATGVARVLDVLEQGGQRLEDRLATSLGRARTLLVLDNCEHVASAVSALLDELLARCPYVHVLATSRVVLGVSGEVPYAVPPLSTRSPSATGMSEAVELFLARAGAASAHLRSAPASEAQRASAARICSELDGLPLAIELAAARARALSLEEIADRISDRFRFLVSWRRLTAARHQTLREAMDWSYDLLDADERSLLEGVSTFVGGFTLAAAADVCLSGNAEIGLQLIEALVDASLVAPEPAPTSTRYHLLETVRQYGAKRLDESGSSPSIRRRHADYFLAMAEEAWVPIRSGDQAATAARLAADQDNLRAALAWFAESDDRERLLRLAEALWWFWWLHGDAAEGSAWLDAALTNTDGLDEGLCARALQGAAGLAWARNDFDAAEQRAERARSLYAGMDTFMTPAGPSPGSLGEAVCLNTLGLIALHRDDLPAARRLFERYLELSELVPEDKWAAQNVAIGNHNLASVAFEQGDLERAAELYAKSLDTYMAAGDDEGAAMAELYLGMTEIYSGRPADGAVRLRRALATYRRVGFLQYLAECLEGAALIGAGRDEATSATAILAAAAAMRTRTGNSPTGRAARTISAAVENLQRALGEDEFRRLWQTGAAWTLDEACQRAEAVLTA